MNSKLTPPSAKNARKRTLFMMKYPEHPQAKAWMARMGEQLGRQAFESYVRALRRGEETTLDEHSKKVSRAFIKGEQNVTT